MVRIKRTSWATQITTRLIYNQNGAKNTTRAADLRFTIPKQSDNTTGRRNAPEPRRRSYPEAYDDVEGRRKHHPSSGIREKVKV